MSMKRSAHSARRSVIAAVVAAVLAVCSLAGLASPSQAQAADRTDTAAAQPTVVLVHGAFADATGWSQEVTLLREAGYPVIAPANPLRGLTADSDYLRSVLATIHGPVVLVGHSYGGAVITNAARGATNVVALVYVAAFVPAEGTSVATSYDQKAHPGSLLSERALLLRPVLNPAAPGGQDADLYIRSSLFRTVFAGDQTRATAATMAATQRPLSYFAFTEPSGAPAWKSIPSWDLVTTQDRAISPGGQRFMAHRAGAHVSAIRSAHDVMVSHPKAVVALITKAARHAK